MALVLDPPLALSDHHAATVAFLHDRWIDDPSVLALLLGGSIAHGFASEHADVDYVAVVTADEFARRAEIGHLTEASVDGADYTGGYTDGKFVDLDFLQRVALEGSEPARFAYRDARLVFEREPLLRPLLARIVEYPAVGVDERIERFGAQLLAWRWYHGQATEKHSRYLELLAAQKLTLFSCRLVLAVNRSLYPYHKWMLRVTADAPQRPDGLMDDLERLVGGVDDEFVDRHVRSLLAFAELDHDDLDRRWGGFFLRDNETTWMTGCSPIDDL